MTPVDRAARAAEEALFADGACGFESTAGAGLVGVDGDVSPVRIARAVIAAIREPSGETLPDGGVFAGFVHDADDIEDNHYIGVDEARYSWRAMIDALLEEGR